jgi:CRP/FNR family cyclic AMP-dependent transcriptional regulator
MFSDASDASLQAVARASMLRRVPRNVQVVRAGERTDFVYLVLSGTLDVLVGDEEGREAILSELGPGELFGEMGMLDDAGRSATVMAIAPSELVAITKTDFRRFMKENFDIALYVMRKLIQRLRAANHRIESLALLDINGRVARVLRDMAETTDGQQVITGKICKQSIARMIGASREMVSRTMRDLELRGLIEVSEGHVVLREISSR